MSYFRVLKGLFWFFEMGLCALLVNSQCFTYCRWQLAWPQFEEAEVSIDTETDQGAAVHWDSSKNTSYPPKRE